MAGDEGRGNMKAHEGTYVRFLSMFKSGTVICAILAAIVVLIIAR